MAIRKFKIMYMAHVMFLLDSAYIEAKRSNPFEEKKKSVCL